ncbi:hypothetical protein [Kribbella catacumbae]|uniref:hypothetical protein n=1 Tax=Kribbella catacumbae TaxID=460086 RepID=UPI00037F8549|nr:hypothetical protein [Kribbella catacumbae]
MTDNVQPGGGGQAAEVSGWEKFLIEAGWAAFAVTLLGSTSVTALISNASEKPGRAGAGDLGTLIVAGLAALALTLGVAIFVAIYQNSDPKPTSYPLAMLAIVCIGGGTLVANFLGFATVGMHDLTQAVSTNSNGNPVVTVGVLIGAFLIAYGWVVAAQGDIVGFLLGRWAAILSRN